MKNTCESCGGELIDRMATKEAPYAYTMSGVKGVELVGIRVQACPRCGVQMPYIPRMAELHRVIARVLVQQPTRLRGDQIRFLRKHAGLPSNEFARLIGVTPEHLSKVENAHFEFLGEQSDRLVRFCVTAIAQDGDAAREVLLEITKTAKVAPPRKGPAKMTPRTFTMEKHKGWKAA